MQALRVVEMSASVALDPISLSPGPIIWRPDVGETPVVTSHGSSKHHFLSAMVENCHVGFLGNFETSTTVEILYISVLPFFRRQGIATALCRALREMFPHKTLVANASSNEKPFYEHLGFFTTPFATNTVRFSRWRCEFAPLVRH